nr:hypothetical protein [Allomuricauda sp.]
MTPPIGKATILGDKLYVLFVDDENKHSYVVFDTVNFEKIEEGTLEESWSANQGFGNEVFKTKFLGSEVLTIIDYGFPSITLGPGVYNLDQKDFTYGQDRFLALGAFQEKLTQIEPDFAGFRGYDVDLANKLVVIAYGLFENGFVVENPKGGVMLIDFDGNIIARVSMENAPEYVVIKN